MPIMPISGDKDSDLGKHIAIENMDYMNQLIQEAMSSIQADIQAATSTTISTNTVGTDSNFIYIGDPPSGNGADNTGGAENGQITLTEQGLQWTPIQVTHQNASSWWPTTPQKPPQVGDIQWDLGKMGLSIYDGSGWKPVITNDELKNLFEEYKNSMKEEVNEIERFLRLESDDVNALPEKLKDELLIQGFRLKIHRLLAAGFKEKQDGTK